MQLNKCIEFECGKEGQRPCTITERIPSCDVGLVESRDSETCLAIDCGKKDQRPCAITERIPSCDKGLFEDLQTYTCEPWRCGAEGQRACAIGERIPSCNKGLSEVLGRCKKYDCGALDQRPCLVTERIPSCDEGLTETVDEKCMRPPCGALDQPACKVTVRIPSCDRGLRETADGKCVVLQPGEIPIFATVGDWSAELEKVVESECISTLEKLHSLPSGIGGFSSIQPMQAKYFRIGFTCATASKLGGLTGYASLVNDLNREMQQYPCAAMTPPLRPVCALYESPVSTVGAVSTCGIALAKEQLIRSEGGSVRDTWLGLGKMAWIGADLVKGKGGKKGKDKGGDSKLAKGSNEAANAKRGVMDGFLKNYGLVIKYTAAAQRFLNGPMCEGIEP